MMRIGSGFPSIKVLIMVLVVIFASIYIPSFHKDYQASVLSDPCDFSTLTRHSNNDTSNFSDFGDTDICTWRLGHKGAVTISYDDGTMNQAAIAAPEMAKRGIKGTFFIVPCQVGEENMADWDAWDEVAAQGHEIGSHSYCHNDLTTLNEEELHHEVFDSADTIEEKLSVAKVSTFCYPYGSYDDEVKSIVEKRYISARIVHHLEANPSSPPDLYALRPTHFFANTSIATMNGYVDSVEANGGWVIEMLHGIDEDYYESIPVNVLTAHLDHLVSKRGSIWTDTMGNVTRYIKERDRSTILVTATHSNVIEVQLSCPFDVTTYDMPLTLMTRVPPAWKYALIEQGEKNEGVAVVWDNNHTYIFYNATPNIGNIRITQTDSLYVAPIDEGNVEDDPIEDESGLTVNMITWGVVLMTIVVVSVLMLKGKERKGK